jgi:ribose transport system permease protein
MAENGDAGISKKRHIKINNTAILFMILAVMFVIASYVGRPFFFSKLNLIPMVNNLSFIGIVAAVLTMVMVTGEIDFSIGGNIGLTACLVALLLEKGLPGWLVVIIALAAGAAMGAFNGMLVTVVGVNSMIATIGTMFIWRGIGYTLTNGESILAMNPVIDFIGRGFIFKVIPFPIVILVIVFIITYIVMNHSKWGRYKLSYMRDDCISWGPDTHFPYSCGHAPAWAGPRAFNNLLNNFRRNCAWRRERFDPRDTCRRFYLKCFI